MKWTTNLHLCVALEAEAKVLIEAYSLGCVSTFPFKYYQTEGVDLVVTGVGKVQAAAACSFVASRHDHDRDHAWLNIGVAGHQTAARGTGFLVDKFIDAGYGKTFYPYPTFEVSTPRSSLCSVDRAVHEYAEGLLYDMEGSAFAQVAMSFSTAELVHAFKVVSDNARYGPSEVTAGGVTSWMEANLPAIRRLSDQLCQRARQQMERQRPPVEQASFESRWRFSVSQRRQLQRYLQRWQVLRRDEALPHCDSSTGAAAVLETLRQMLSRPGVASGRVS